jgi:hypothetical protein
MSKRRAPKRKAVPIEEHVSSSDEEIGPGSLETLRENNAVLYKKFLAEQFKVESALTDEPDREDASKRMNKYKKQLDELKRQIAEKEEKQQPKTSIPAVHEESAPPDPVPQELEPPVETQIAPEVSNPPEVQEARPARTSRVRELTKLKNLSPEEKQLIIEEWN